ncbi:MAG: hypothetical protein JXR94_19935, partial [Candidatus Hydrogenedentes bacterium]|nr:hypothetical protein [Candidatus Hydrogenedentota bacterium]
MRGETALERQLIRDQVVTREELVRAREDAARDGTPLPEALVAGAYATAEAVFQSLAAFCELPYVTPSRMDIAPG